MRPLAAALPLALALAARVAAAQTPPPEPPPAPAPAPKVTVDLGGWLVLNGFFGSGGLNVVDQPRYAIPGLVDERTTGFSVRQSRLRANLGIPSEGLVPGAQLRGLLELDFMGGYVNADPSLPIVRLRHAWLTAAWKDRGNLTLLLGQTWGVFTGPWFAQSLSHLATPRFAGAGFLYRRAPQVRLSGELGGNLQLRWAAAALAPIDRATATAAGASVGERSGLPDLEARVAAAMKAPVAFEVGLSAHLGREKHVVAGPPPRDDTVDSRGYAIDARVEAPYVTLVGAAFVGENLDVWYSVAPGVRAGATDVTNVVTMGFWAQAQVTPVKGLVLLLGGGVEQPEDSDLPVPAAGAVGAVRDSKQASAGALLNLTSRWRVGLEATRYWTKTVGGPLVNATQVEASSLLAF